MSQATPAPAAAAPAEHKDKGAKPKKEKGGAKEASAPAPASPEYQAHRLKIWEALFAKQQEEFAAKAKKEEAKIVVTLPDGKHMDGIAGVTSALDIAHKISKSLAEKVIVAKVDGEIHDAWRPLQKDCKLELCDFETKEGSHTFWHSSAHILGQALEAQFGCNLCIGPPLEDGGFYYDCEMGGRTVVPEDFAKLQSVIDKMISEKHQFQRLVLSKKDALEMFKHNPFKVEIISSKIPEGGICTAYRCGPLIDLCKGPHVSNTGMIKAMTVTKNSSAYWLGNANNPQLQRVYGISFPDKKKLKEYLEFLELAAQRDHRKVGADQQLFFFHDISPGSCFFLPHGARIYNKLIDFIRTEYRKRGFTEVISPNVFNIDLWKTSGHYDNYKENMFLFEVEKVEFGMKPMNCPGHCIMFKHLLRSYRDLPVRYADFGVLHRNEFSGALTGLTRVRRFQQDDAHIFCRENQIEQEVGGALDFLTFVYSKFGFQFSIALSTRPEKYLGELEQWDRAEKALAGCLDASGHKWKLNPGDGAFYGPKIDIQLTDALKRKHQCATIQLDFQLPIRFGLQYKNEDGSFARPVIIHRAILGSVERMIAVLTEHTGGKWPFWLSPRQAVVIPVAPNFIDYASQVQKRLWDAGYNVDVDDSRNQLNKKIREGQLAQYNFILVVGGEEQAADSVNVRTRDNQVHGIKSVAQLIDEWKQLSADFQ